MNKFTRISAIVFALCLSAAVMTGCGDSNNDKKAGNETSKASPAEEKKEKELDEALDKLEQETAEELEKENQAAESAAAESEAESVVEEIKYEATEEIKNAPLNSGYIQIGDTVFRDGNYITVAEFIEKYSDKFDMSEIPVDEYLTSRNYTLEGSAKITSFNDPRLVLYVMYGKYDAEDKERVKVTDATVDTVYLYDPSTAFVNEIKVDNENADLIFYPQNVKPMDYEDAKAFCVAQGFEEDGEFINYDISKGYVYYGDAYEEWESAFYIQMKGAEPNLYNYYPEIDYKLKFDPATLKATGSNYDVSRLGKQFFPVDGFVVADEQEEE